MDMRVDSRVIRAERERRAWSQEQLARVSGLGLRTIQRIEKTGAASFESAKALAAVFAFDVAALRAPALPPTKSKAALPVRPLLGAAAVLLSTGGALLVSKSGLAEQVMLDVAVAVNEDQRVDNARLLTDAGTAGEISVDELVRLLIVPTIEPNGSVRLSTQVFQFKQNDWVLVSEPKLVTPDGAEAQIELGLETGSAFRFIVTPHRQP
jgi:transcriptional regulator with XRE-family HTH domain